MSALAPGIAGVAHAVRLARWRGLRTTAEPLVTVLHLAYAFTSIGAIAITAAILWPAAVPYAVAIHLWSAGAIGLMTLAVMTRATLGHTGQALHAGKATVAIYGRMVCAVLLRTIEGLTGARMMIDAAGAAWIIAFVLFCVYYGALVWRPGRT